jgi:uncharacterized membrane protein YjfL (UPF0719 family)
MPNNTFIFGQVSGIIVGMTIKMRRSFEQTRGKEDIFSFGFGALVSAWLVFEAVILREVNYGESTFFFYPEIIIFPSSL